MIYDGIITKPPLDLGLLESHSIKHYNHNHDPKSGKFTSSFGGISISPKTRKLMGETLARDIKNNHNDNPHAKRFKSEQTKTMKKLLTEDELNEIGRRVLELPNDLSDDEWDAALANISKDLDEWMKKKNINNKRR